MATVFSILLALLFFFYPQEELIGILFSHISYLVQMTGAIFLILIPLINALLLIPIQKTGIFLSPLSVEIFRKDRLYQIVNLLIFSFAILCFAVAADPDGVSWIPSRTMLFSLWLVFLGIAIDGTWFIIRRAFHYMNPKSVIKQCTLAGLNGIKEGKNSDVWESIDALSEISIQGVDKGHLFLSIQTLQSLEEIIRTFLRSYKSISRPIKKNAEETDDVIRYGLFYLFQRLELIGQKALEKKNEPVLSQLLASYAKIVYFACEFDVSLMGYPLHFIGKLAKKALANDVDEAAERASCSLVEVVRAIVNEIDLTYTELQEPFLTLVSVLEGIAQETFQKDKSVKIEILMQPFKDLEEIFSQEKMQKHQDNPIILQDIKRVLQEFSTLQTVMDRMPSYVPSESERIREEMGKNHLEEET